MDSEGKLEQQDVRQLYDFEGENYQNFKQMTERLAEERRRLYYERRGLEDDETEAD